MTERETLVSYFAAHTFLIIAKRMKRKSSPKRETKIAKKRVVKKPAKAKKVAKTKAKTPRGKVRLNF
jgi:uncharacterized membrane protein YbaN (DUF454 family)